MSKEKINQIKEKLNLNQDSFLVYDIDDVETVINTIELSEIVEHLGDCPIPRIDNEVFDDAIEDIIEAKMNSPFFRGWQYFLNGSNKEIMVSFKED